MLMDVNAINPDDLTNFVELITISIIKTDCFSSVSFQGLSEDL